MNAAYLKQKHQAALPWPEYLATDPEKAANWKKFYDSITLTPTQQTLLHGFVREIKILVVSGIWCGDCVQQGPLLQRIAEARACLDLRWIDRDEQQDLAESVKVNGGLRVPIVIFMAEDYEPVSIMGDRPLSRYRTMAAAQLGNACPLPDAPVPEQELADSLQDWLNEFERVHLLLRLSGRLREIHRD